MLRHLSLPATTCLQRVSLLCLYPQTHPQAAFLREWVGRYPHTCVLFHTCKDAEASSLHSLPRFHLPSSKHHLLHLYRLTVLECSPKAAKTWMCEGPRGRGLLPVHPVPSVEAAQAQSSALPCPEENNRGSRTECMGYPIHLAKLLLWRQAPHSEAGTCCCQEACSFCPGPEGRDRDIGSTVSTFRALFGAHEVQNPTQPWTLNSMSVLKNGPCYEK